MKILLCLLLCSCTTINYKYTDPDNNIHKEVSISTFGKQVTDLQILYSPEVFAMSLGNTTNDDIFGDIAKIIGEYQ